MKGSPKATEIDILQLTAQAVCLEEMFFTDIQEGAIFYGETCHRQKVVFSSELKECVKTCFTEMDQMYDWRYTPKVT